MLAQAQEVFLERAISEKKKHGLVAKLAAHAAFAYALAGQSLVVDTVKSQFDKSWIDLSKIKAKHFEALADYHKGLQCELDNQYGEAVGHLTRAEYLSREAINSPSRFIPAFPPLSSATSYLVGSPPRSGAGPLTTSPSSSTIITAATSSAVVEWMRQTMTVLADRKAIAIKDNEVIYHASIPSLDSLPPVEKQSAVRPISFVRFVRMDRRTLRGLLGVMCLLGWCQRALRMG
ncbi:BRO1 domain-containing protein [Chytridium lagenaria]|nr:BRO1 domain-containing protein [Chytridium lagenaria]